MNRAAGILFATRDGRVLLLRRAGEDHKGEWAFPGGGIEAGETAEDAARRELTEETGHKYEGPLTLWTRRQKDGVDFTTFLAKSDAFEPQLNEEHDRFAWVDRQSALDGMDLHPGARIALMRTDLDELGIAKAIRSGELVSPQSFGNLLLIALRITGTGASYRAGIDQYVWRDPSLYLTDHFLERCNGLPVVWEHPKDKPALDTEDFRKRIIGTILLPYIQGDEVWGIAKILDMDAGQILCDEQLSTSPCVVFVNQSSGEKYRTEDGKTLLVEGAPRLLDHLAIVANGVWDKEGPPTGVANEGTLSISDSTHIEGQVMPDPIASTETMPDTGVSGNKEGEKLDKILAHLDSLHSKHDALCSRMDAFEAKHKEPATEEGNLKTEGEPAPVVADGKKDGEAQPGTESSEKALTEERTENGLAKNDSATEPMMDSKADAAIKALQDQLVSLQKRIPTELRDEDRQKFVAAQMKAERVAQAFGDSQGAPRWLQGESLTQYRQRLLGKYKQHSANWKGVELSKLNADALDIVETQVYADAYQAATSPSTVEAGTLRSVTETDYTGRRITRFYGDPEACWGPFKRQARLVSGWQTKFN
jgi:hypothetical protein